MVDHKQASIYDAHARRCDETDFWGQVRRTVNGRPVPEEQIAMIVGEMETALDLRGHDVLLDICCGNGALSARFFERCAGGLGIDYSDTLIDVARKYFDRGPEVTYETGEAIDFLHTAAQTGRFSKALIYGSLCYFSRQDAERILRAVRQRFEGVSRFVIGNVADMAHLHDFFGDRYAPGVEDDPQSPIGVWWPRDMFEDMAKRAGWSVEFRRMPEAFYASHYRFDAVLRPQ